MRPRYRVPDILAILLLAALVALAWFDLYLPSRDRNSRAQLRVVRSRAHRDETFGREALLAERRDRLQAREAEIVETSIRQHLRWGLPGEKLMPQSR